jgi:DNA repair protein RecN (Recombination protein N)
MTDAVNALKVAGRVSAELEELATRLQSALYDVHACAEEAAESRANLCFDEQELAQMEDRLALIGQLTKKYATDEAGVLAQREDLQAQLDAIVSSDEYLADLQAQSAVAREATIAASERLTAARRQAAVTFEKDVCAQLSFLDMPHVRLEVSIEPTALTAIGGDKVEFLIASNPGEPAKSIARTASGGELSRVMLAIKAVMADREQIGTMIFDEVDTGVSGRMAQVVGEKMASIGKSRQVIAVSHLPQIAALGDAHYLVEKQVVDGRTVSGVVRLDEDGRIREVARMIGGSSDMDSALQHAKNMIQAGKTE